MGNLRIGNLGFAGPEVNVLDLDVILLLPLQIEAAGDLHGARSNPKNEPSAWLTLFAKTIEGLCKGNGWKYLADPFGERFGFPGLYSSDAKRFAEFAYFHPFIQRVLYERDPSKGAMAVLARRDLRQLAVTLNDSTELIADVRRAQMFLFTTDLAVVAVQLHVPADRLSKARTTQSALANAFSFLDQVRRVYTPYWLENNPGQTPLSAQWRDEESNQIGRLGDYRCQDQLARSIGDRRPPIIAHWESLITPWLDAPDPKDPAAPIAFRQLGDERCHTMAYLSLDRPHDLAESDHYRLAFLDAAGEGWAYNPDFLRAQAGDTFYDRFWHSPAGWMNTRYMSTGYSFVLLRDGYEGANYLHDHFQNHYFFLNLLALMQKCSILIAWERLSKILRTYASADQSEGKRLEFHNEQKWLSEDLADYIALFEFSEVSNQLQALELFAMIRKNLHCATLLKELLEQVGFARGVEQRNYEEQMQERAQRLATQQTKLSNIAIRWLPVSLTLAFLGMSIGMDDFNYWLHHPGSGLLDPVRVAVVVLVPILIWVGFWTLFKIFSVGEDSGKRKSTEAL